MKSVSQQNTASDKHWLVMNEQGERFGPVNVETLKLWAKDGRLAPTNTVSEDEKVWKAVTQLADLEMDWVAEVSPGAFYGPIHKEALEALKKEGAIPVDALTFQRSCADRLASTTQPIPAPAPESPPPKQEESGALQALERQLDLERQRSHDAMKQLQQAEIRVATSEARTEAGEKAHKHYAAQMEQAQQHLTAQLEQTNKQLTHIHAQLLAREQELQRTEQRLVSFERIEPLLKEGMLQMSNQQQELKTLISATQENASFSTEPLETVVKDALAQLVGQQQEFKTLISATQENASFSTKPLETVVRDALAQLVSQQEELKTLISATQESASFSTEPLETVVKDALAQLVGQQQEFKAAITATEENTRLADERIETTVRDALAQLVNQQQELKVAVATTEENRSQSAGRVETLVKDALAQLATPQQNQATEILIEKLSAQLTSAFKASQNQLFLDLAKALKTEGAQICCAVNKNHADKQDLALQQIIQTLKLETPPLLAQLTQQGLALHRLNDELKAVGSRTAEALVPAVATLLDRGHEETVQRLCAKLEEGREHLSGRTQTALSQWHEQSMRATGESQRLAIEYIVRELTTIMNQAVQAGRETFLQSARGGWTDVKQQTAALESHIKQLADAQQRLTHELKAALEKQLATPPPPTVKRTYVEAEAVEVIPPDRTHKKTKPAPEPSDPSPPQNDTRSTKPSTGLSMADIEQQAQRELQRMGAQGMNIFKRKS